MTVAFLVLSCLVAAGLLGGIIYVGKRGCPDRKTVQLLFSASFFAVMSNALAANAPIEQMAMFFFGCSFASMDWLLYMLFQHVSGMAEYSPRSRIFRRIFLVCCAADTISMITNIELRHVFSCRIVEITSTSVCFHMQLEMLQYAFWLHEVLYFGMQLAVLYMCFAQMSHTIKLYRGRYRNAVWSLIVAMLLSLGGRILEFPLDITPILYALMAMASIYFLQFYVARGVVAKLLSLLIEDTQQAIICFDREGKCIQVNDAFMRIFEAGGNTGPFETYLENWRSKQPGGELREKFWREEHEMDGETHYFDAHFNLLQDDKGNYVGNVFSFIDRTDSIRDYELQRYTATHDDLTDIYNRERFFQRVSETLKETPDVKRVMVCIDVKDFSVVNDLFGEKVGNQILQRIAGLMRRDASEDTLYGRLESDHFAMCMREENFIEENYPQYLEDLKRIVHSSVYRMHVHVGVYHITDPTISISVMCDRAFVAIESIKDSYQEIIAYYTESMGHSEQREKVMIGEFDRALAAGEFRMFLQPQVAVGDYTVLGAEALVRWDHPVRGMVSPGEFIPVFEQSGYITRLDNYMWELACRQLRIWKDQGIENLHISVNISPKDFYLVNIYDTFTSLVERYEINPANLKLEITETALMEEISKHLSLLQKLREYGFHVEIDDFGSGYSSLNTLQDIEVDVLKLDMGFLRKTTHEKRSKTIMNAVINMSKNLGLTVVTEGVETIEQVNYLTEAGCDIFQGYYFAKPMPVKEFEKKYLEERRALVSG